MSDLCNELESLLCPHISCADPEISEELNVTDVTQTSVSLSWSTGKTQHIDYIEIHRIEIDSSGSATEWTRAVSTSSHSSHTVMSLTAGTNYEFYVQIFSYNYSAKTNIIKVETGIR